jgi:hypothetical protein
VRVFGCRQVQNSADARAKGANRTALLNSRNIYSEMFTQIPGSRNVVKHKQSWSDRHRRRWLFQCSFDNPPSRTLLQWQSSNNWDDSWNFVVVVETVHNEGPLEVGSAVTLRRDQQELRVEVCRILEQKGFKLCALVQAV